MAGRAAEAAAALQAEPLRAANRARALLGALRAPGDGRGEDGAAAGIAAEALGGYLAVMERTGYLGPRRRGREAPIDAEADGAGGGGEAAGVPPPGGPAGEEAKLRRWLEGLRQDYLRQALAVWGDGALRLTLRSAALTGMMEVVRASGAFDSALYSQLVGAVALGEGGFDERGVGLLVAKFMDLIDVRYYTWVAVRNAAARADAGEPGPDAARNLYDLLAAVGDPAAGPGEAWVGDGAAGAAPRRRGAGPANGGPAPPKPPRWAQRRHQHQAFSDAWVALLRLELPDDVSLKVLESLHEDVMPHLVNPVLLSEFLVRSLEQGGYRGILALNGLFLLVTQHGMEYPKFYTRLYGLLTPATLQSRRRVEFFRLVDLFLKSAMVPAYVVAAFIKRFARMALRASPAGALICLAFAHNLLRRHPPCLVLLHNPGARGADVPEDPFRELAADPAESRALESSLWEVATLQAGHYAPDVVRFCGLFRGKDFAHRHEYAEVPLEPALLAGGYGPMLAEGLKARKLKNTAHAFYRAGAPGLASLFA